MEEKIKFYVQERDHRAEILSILRGNDSDVNIKEQLLEYHEHDIANAFEELTDDERERLTGILGSEIMSEIVSHLDDAGDYLSALDAEDAAEIIEQMDADDALEALDDLDEETRSEIFDRIEDAEIREDIALLDSYEDTEFGSRMSTNFIAVKRSFTVKETMKALV